MAKVVVLSGAGISAESGISTFRDSDGLWEKYKIEDVCMIGCLENNRKQTIEFYNARRLELKTKKPNKAHKILANLKNKYPKEISIITQNVDDLFEKAGIKHDDVIHLHGFLTEVRCEKCNFVYDIGYQKLTNDQKCPKCKNNKIRPNIVMFGEMAPLYEELYKQMEDCELFIAIGTSGKVVGVNSFAAYTKRSILNILEPSEAIEEELFSKILYKKATDAIDEIAKEIEKICNIYKD